MLCSYKWRVFFSIGFMRFEINKIVEKSKVCWIMYVMGGPDDRVSNGISVELERVLFNTRPIY